MALQQGGPGTGYRDPMKAMTIKALQDRQKAAALATAKSMEAPATIASPWQGLSHLTGVLGAEVTQNRADAAEGDARNRLATLMAQIDPNTGATQQQLADIGTLDPEFAKAEYARAMAAREAVAAREDTQQFQTGERVGGQEFTGGQNELNRQADIAKQDDAQKAAAELSAQGAGQTGTLQEAADTRGAAEKRIEEQAQVAENKRKEQLAQTDTGKIMQDYNNNAYGPVGSPEAIAARDDAMRKATFTQPTKIADLMSPGAIKTDQDVAPQITEWKTSGGPNTIKAVTQVNKALELLQHGGSNGIINPTGFLAGLADANLPSAWNRLVNPDGTIARDAIRETTQQTLRQTLGAQFTEKEGTDLMNRAFEIGLGPDENIRRAKLLLDNAVRIAQNKQEMVDYWDSHHQSLQGYTPKPIDARAVLDMFKDGAGGDAGGGAGGGTTGAPAAPAESDDDYVRRVTGRH